MSDRPASSDKARRIVLIIGIVLVLSMLLCCALPLFLTSEIDRVQSRMLRSLSEVDAELLHEESNSGSSATGCAGGRIRRLYGTNLDYAEIEQEYESRLERLGWRRQSANATYLVNPDVAWFKERNERSIRGYRLGVAFAEMNIRTLEEKLQEFSFTDANRLEIENYRTLYILELAWGRGISCF